MRGKTTHLFHKMLREREENKNTMRYLRFLPALAVLAGVATTVTIYAIFASVFGSSEDYHLSSVLSVGCEPDPILQLAYGNALVG